MKSFELPEVTECTLKHVNHRYEFHGDEKVLAIDLSLHREGGNEILNDLDPTLRETLCFNKAADAGQVDMPDVLAVLPNLRAPLLNGGKFAYGGKDKYKGYRFVMDYGLGDEKSNVEFTDASAGKHVVVVKEGGSAEHDFQISYAGTSLTDDVLTKLIRHEGGKVFIQVLAPAVLTLVKGGKAPKVAAAEDGEQQDLVDDENDDEGGDDRTVENAFTEGSQAAAG